MTDQPAFRDGPPSWPPQIEQLQKVFHSLLASGDWGRYHSEHTGQLEQHVASLVDQPHVRLTCSGTIAVELALRGLSVAAGDEVILGGYDFPGNFRSIENCGARPVLVDIDPNTGCMTADQIAAGLTSQTKAILVSHLHSGMAPMKSISELASQHKVLVLEDACQSPGAIVDGQPAGSWGDVTTLSFGGSKLLTAGRGGAVASRREDILQRIRVFADRGNDAFPLSQIQAAILNVQFESLASQNQKRRQSVATIFQKLLHEATGIQIVGAMPNDQTAASYYKVLFPLDPAINREAWIRALQTEGVAIDAGFRGFAKRSANRCTKIGDLENSRNVAEHAVVLHHPILLESAAKIELLCEVLQQVTKQHLSP
ncbi:MAG: aminotransferase class V-fold PLP-dependent enzyme [Planctomycetota bacterium]